MNRRAPGDTQGAYRWRNAALAMNETLTRTGSTSRSQGGRRALSIYADSDYARSLRASDLRRFAGMSAAEKRALLKKREQMFGLEPGSLTTPRVPPAMTGDER